MKVGETGTILTSFHMEGTVTFYCTLTVLSLSFKVRHTPINSLQVMKVENMTHPRVLHGLKLSLFPTQAESSLVMTNPQHFTG